MINPVPSVPPLTVMTAPLPSWGRRLLDESLSPRYWWSRIQGLPPPFQKYGGHKAVTRSLLAGLNSLGLPVLYNPRSERSVGQVVVVLQNIRALRQAIHWKQQGRIRTLLAGPNLMVYSDEHQGILAAPEIDHCLVPSDWVRCVYEARNPGLIGRIRIWPAGVNESVWCPSRLQPDAKEVLIYWKTEPEAFCQAVEQLVQRLGWQPIRVRYKDYTHEQYRQLLDRCRLAVFISRSESQGLALAEAWAMNRPTFVWDPEELILEGYRFPVVSAAPYLTQATGQKWRTLDELQLLLNSFPDSESHFQPRSWVLQHMTDSCSARRLLYILDEACPDGSCL